MTLTDWLIVLYVGIVGIAFNIALHALLERVRK